MYKKLIILVILMISIVGLGACNKDKIEMDTVDSNSLVYGNYEYGNFFLSIVNPKNLKTNQKIKITEGWTDNINQDKFGKIWIPIVSEDGSMPKDNRVVVVDLKNKTKKEIKVGDSPHYIYFKNSKAYVVCDEDGINPSLYRVDENFKSTKVKTIKKGGLINGVTFDGEYIYLLANHVDYNNNKQYPMIEKLSLNGKVVKKIITKKDIGNNALSVVGNKLVVGLQAGKRATLGVFDKDTLRRLKDFTYMEDMVGQILPIKNNVIAITNYSKVAAEGNKITFLDIDQNKIIKIISTKSAVESLSLVDDNHLFYTDNIKEVGALLDENGKEIRSVKIPTQVYNIVQYN